MPTQILPDPSRPNQQDDLWRGFIRELRTGSIPPFEEHWLKFQEIYGGRRAEDGPPLVWRPAEEQITWSNLGRFMESLGFNDYRDLHDWSVRERAEFWGNVLQRLGIVFVKQPASIVELAGGVKDPCWLPGAVMNCVDSCFTASPEKIAVIEGREGAADIERTSYGKLERLVNRVANGLVEQGFKENDGVALYMPMTLECVAAYLGIVRAGCRVISIADSFSPTEIHTRLGVGGGRGIITVDRFSRGGKIIPLYQKVQDADAPRAIVIPTRSGEAVRLRDGDLLWGDFLSANDSFESVVGGPYRVTNVLFSSGTTAAPKAIPWTHLTPIKCAMDGHFHQDIHEDDVVAWPTNVGWMMGPWLIYASLINEAAMALFEGVPTGEGFDRFVREARVSVLGVVPSLVRAWRSSSMMQPGDWDNVRVFSSTGEPSNREDYLWLMSLANYRAPVIEYCGGTEVGGAYITGTVVQPASPATFTTPALGIDFVLLDPEGKQVSEGEMGETYLIPPSIGLSQTLLNKNHDEVYYVGCPTGPGGEVLRRHGDQMMRLHRGFYKAQGRADDTMNLGGIKVGSLELERVLNAHEAVYESAAVAVQPEGEGAEKLVVFVVLKQDVDAGQLVKELGTMVAKEINPLFKIYDLRVIDQLPRTASNKLMRRQLRARYMER